MRSVVFVLFFFAFGLVQGIAGEIPPVVAVLDAGSTGSRIHVYVIENNKTIRKIFTEKVNIPLASFASQPEAVGPLLAPLLIHAEAALATQGVTVEAVPLFIYSTAGMRLLPVQSQKEINTALKQYIDDQFSLFQKGGVQVRTISGPEEGFFAWISLNEINQTLGADAPQTVGIVEMGGASTQIAFAVNYVDKDVFSFERQGKQYHVMSKSFLGAGHRSGMDGVNNRPACYPTGSPISTTQSGNYNYTACLESAHQYFGQFYITQNIGALPQNMTFYGVSGFYYNFAFFGVAKTEAGLSELQGQAQNLCTKDWETLKNLYPTQKIEYLQEYCFAAAYDRALLMMYGFSSNGSAHLKIIDKLNNQTVDWTSGVIVSHYFLVWPFNTVENPVN